MMSRTSNRRGFLKSSALAGVGYWIAASSTTAHSRSPNEKLNIGVIGVDGRGAANMEEVAEREHRRPVRRGRRTTWPRRPRSIPKAKTYHDWRKMLDQKDIDAVVVSTADHTHAPVSRRGDEALGKHVYCEKPLAHSVHEARMMRDISQAEEGGHADGHADPRHRQLPPRGGADPNPVRSGRCTRRTPGSSKASKARAVGHRKPASPCEVPLGPLVGPGARAALPSVLLRERSMSWQNWWDFGNGALGDMGSHIIDLPFWALELRSPTTVEAEGPLPVRPETYPDSLKVRWEHPACGNRPAVTLTWYDGHQWPKSPADVRPVEVAPGNHVHRRQGDVGRRLRSLPAAAGNSVQGFPSAAALDRPIVGPSPGVDSRLQDRRADALQLRLLGLRSSTTCWARLPFARARSLSGTRSISGRRTVPQPISSFGHRIVRAGQSSHESSMRCSMKLPRRELLKSAAALAAGCMSRAGMVRAATDSATYPYLGRTEDYVDFQIIEPGLAITKVESWTQGQYGIVRITTNDGHEGYGQVSSFEPDITATVLHRQVAPYALGSDPARIDDLVDRVIDANMKFPWSYICRALSGIDTAIWDLYGQIRAKPVCELLGGKTDPFPVYGSSMRRDISPEDEAVRLVQLRDAHGFEAFKVRLGVPTGHNHDTAPGRTEALISTVRRAVGDKIQLLADGNSCYTPSRAIEVGRRMEDNRYFWFEEPCPYWELEWTAEVAAALKMNVAGGEQDNDLAQWRRIVA